MQLDPVSFYYKQEAIGDGTNELVSMHEHLGLIVEDAAAVDRRYAIWGWTDVDDPIKPAPVLEEPGRVEKREGESLEDQITRQQLHNTLTYLGYMEQYNLERARPVMWDHYAVISDLIASVHYLYSELNKLK